MRRPGAAPCASDSPGSFAPGHGFVLVAEHESVPVAAAVFLRHNGTVIYKYGASDDAAWAVRPNHAIFWRAISDAWPKPPSATVRARWPGAEIVIVVGDDENSLKEPSAPVYTTRAMMAFHALSSHGTIS